MPREVKEKTTALTFAPKPWVKRFLKNLTLSGNVAWSAERAKISTSAVNAERGRNPLFAQQCRDALEVSLSVLEMEARRRAFEGDTVPIVSKGEVVAHVQKYSDTLLMFLLKAGRPHVYRDNVTIEHELGPNATSTAAALISAMRQEATVHALESDPNTYPYVVDNAQEDEE